MASINEYGVYTNMDQFNIDESLTFSEVNKTKMGSDIVYINSRVKDRSSKFYVQLDKMPAVFGLSKWQSETGNAPPKLSIDLSFRNKEENPKQSAFLKFLFDLDDVVINTGRKNYLAAEKSLEVAQELYKKSVKQTEGYSPTVKVAVTPNTKLYNSRKEEIEISEENIPKGAILDVIMSISSIWIINKKSFGISIRAEQIRVRESRNDKLTGYAFEDSNDEDNLSQCEEDDECQFA